MGAHRVRWTLDADEEVSWVLKSDPGNVDLLNARAGADSAATAGTPMQKIIGLMRGRSLRANSLQI